jgi:hypothetical protein
MKAQPKDRPVRNGVAINLADNLTRLATAYGSAKGIKLSVVGVHVRNDQRFFTDKVQRFAFTVAAYDSTIDWFDRNWPKGARWPAGIQRPSHGVST